MGRPTPGLDDLAFSLSREFGAIDIRRRLLDWVLIGVANVLILIPLTAFFLSQIGDDDTPQAVESPTTTESEPCIVSGQVFDVDREPISAAWILVRPPGESSEGAGSLGSPVLAVTDAEGRYEGSCSDFNKPFAIAVRWELVLGSDEFCECGASAQ